MNEKKSNHQTPPLAQIQIRRRFYTEDASMVYAIRYIEQNFNDLGNLNQAVLDAFHCFYAPFGMDTYGNSDEALKLAMKSVALLQSHASYIMAKWGLTPSTVNDMSYLLTSGQTGRSHHSKNRARNEHQNGHANPGGLSEEEMQAVSIYKNLSN